MGKTNLIFSHCIIFITSPSFPISPTRFLKTVLKKKKKKRNERKVAFLSSDDSNQKTADKHKR